MTINWRQRAQAAGYREETCAKCGGAGRSERLYLGTPGVEYEDPCSVCEGTGTMWSAQGQMPWIRDSGMRATFGA